MKIIKPYPIRRCFRCGRRTRVHTSDPKQLKIDPETKRSPIYCRVCWPKLSQSKRDDYRKDGFVTLN